MRFFPATWDTSGGRKGPPSQGVCSSPCTCFPCIPLTGASRAGPGASCSEGHAKGICDLGPFSTKRLALYTQKHEIEVLVCKVNVFQKKAVLSDVSSSARGSKPRPSVSALGFLTPASWAQPRNCMCCFEMK